MVVEPSPASDGTGARRGVLGKWRSDGGGQLAQTPFVGLARVVEREVAEEPDLLGYVGCGQRSADPGADLGRADPGAGPRHDCGVQVLDSVDVANAVDGDVRDAGQRGDLPLHDGGV